MKLPITSQHTKPKHTLEDNGGLYDYGNVAVVVKTEHERNCWLTLRLDRGRENTSMRTHAHHGKSVA